MKENTSKFIAELLELFVHADGMAAEEGRVTSDYIPYDPEMFIRVVKTALQMEKAGKISLSDNVKKSLKITLDDTDQYIKKQSKKAKKEASK